MRAFVVSVAVCLGLCLAAGTSVAAPDPMVRRDDVVYSKPGKPSGFWGSGQPAKGGAYRWRLLGIGVVLLGGTGLLMIRLVRRANRERTRSER